MANNSSRYLGHSGHYFQGEIDSLKAKATQKQIKFFLRLKYLCKENGIEYTKEPRGRVEFSEAIDELLKLLQEHGVDVKGNGKKFDHVIEVREPSSVLEASGYYAKLDAPKND